jgi:PAS domain S-box-containing protein
VRKSQVAWHFPRVPQSVAWRYAVAVAAFVISFFLREALAPWLSADRGFILFLPAIILVAAIADLGPAILTALLSGVAMWYFFLPPYNSFEVDLDGAVGLATFVVGSAVGIALVHCLRNAQGSIAADLLDMDRLNQLSNRFLREGGEIDKCLAEVIVTAIAISGADKGNVQLLDSDSGALTIAAQQGFKDPFLKFFEYTRDDASACAVAMRSLERVIVEDVRSSKIFAGQPSQNVMIDAGVRAVVSTPLMSSAGNILGMVSIHFSKPHRPSERDLRLIDLLARQTADYLERKRAERYAQRLSAVVEFSDDAIVTKDLDGIITSWNRGAERMFGYTAEEAIGKPVMILIPPDRHNEEPEIISRIRRGEHVDHYETIRQRKDGSMLDISLTISPLHDNEGRVVGASKIARDITERKRSQEINQILMREIQHRSQNLMAVIQAIAHMSLSDDYSPAQARKAFEARLQALARANGQLSKSNWSGVNLSEIARIELEPFADRTTVEGVTVALGAQYAQNFSLALHELATNAAKYGALSNGSGKVKVFWTVASDGKHKRLQFKWQEREGPLVVAPTRKGFGTTLLKAAFEDVRFDFAIEGLSCEIDALLDHSEPGAGPKHPVEALYSNSDG